MSVGGDSLKHPFLRCWLWPLLHTSCRGSQSVIISHCDSVLSLPPDLSHSLSLLSHPHIQPSVHCRVEAQELLIEMNSVEDFWNRWEATPSLFPEKSLATVSGSVTLQAKETSGTRILRYLLLACWQGSISLPIPLPPWSALPKKAD